MLQRMFVRLLLASAAFVLAAPYALALDVEQDWAEKFSAVLGRAGTAPGNSAPAYTPFIPVADGTDSAARVSRRRSVVRSLRQSLLRLRRRALVAAGAEVREVEEAGEGGGGW